MELNELLDESIELMEKEFKNKKFYFSYSSLNLLLWNPVIFHQLYILKIKEDKIQNNLVQGSAIHCLLLEPHNFENKFIVVPNNLPTGSTKTVIDKVFLHKEELAKHGDTREHLSDFESAILDVLKDINLHQSLKTDQQRIDKICNDESEKYWNFLKQKKDKTLIDEESYNFCLNAVEVLKTNKKICGLIGCDITDFDNKEVFNELLIEKELEGKNYGLKGIVDNLVIDHDKKIVYINDIKTTSKDLKNFPESIENYSYWMQAVIYCALVSLHLSHLLEKDYKLKFNFIVIDKYFQVYPFEVSEGTLHIWFDKLKDALHKAEWHYENSNYNLPYEFATESVIL